MKKMLMMALPVLASLPLGTAARAETNFGYNLSLYVPVICTLTHVPGSFAQEGNAVSLGALHEYCNAPAGYKLVVSYSPGSLQGAVIIAGTDRVVLDGSGQTIVARSSIPQIRELDIAAVPGQAGFDTDHLDFQMVAA